MRSGVGVHTLATLLLCVALACTMAEGSVEPFGGWRTVPGQELKKETRVWPLISVYAPKKKELFLKLSTRFNVPFKQKHSANDEWKKSSVLKHTADCETSLNM